SLRTSRQTGWSSIPQEITSGYPAILQRKIETPNARFRCRPASSFAFIHAFTDKHFALQKPDRNRVKLIIFDFDGTLVDSRSLILESHRIVFSQFRLPLPPAAACLSLVGQTLDLILEELAGPAAPIRDMVRAYDFLLPQLRADPAFAEKPFEGMADLLRD